MFAKNIENWGFLFWIRHFEFFFQKKIWGGGFISMKISSTFIWGIIYFCTMDGFSRILEKKLSELLCTRLYWVDMQIWISNPSETIVQFCPEPRTLFKCHGVLENTFNWPLSMHFWIAKKVCACRFIAKRAYTVLKFYNITGY